MTTPLDKAKRRRAAKRAVVNDVITKLNAVLNEDFDDSNVAEVASYGESITTLSEEIKRYDDDIFDLLDEENDLNADEQEAQEYRTKSKTALAKMKIYMRNSKEARELATSSSSGTVSIKTDGPKSKGLKLPKLEATTFNGDSTHWRSFSEFFNAAVHENESLSNVEKYTYLKSYVKGAAAEALEGLPVTGDNYEHARDLLEKRYGNPQLIISTHMSKLMKLKEVRTANARELRTLYDKIEANVRALTSLGIGREEIGPMLIPIILEKLPDAIRLQVSRGLGDSHGWKIDEFLKKIEEEIMARESYSFLKSDGNEKNRNGVENVRSSVASLNVNNGQPVKCVFCKNIGHYSDKCNIVTEMKARIQVIKDNRLCFKCLQGHPIRKCQSKTKCFKCQSTRHHTAICDSDHGKRYDDQQNDIPQENAAEEVPAKANQMLSANNTSVMLQTVTVTVTDVNEQKSVKCNLIFDGGAQRTYISQRVVDYLALPKTDVGEMTINTFGDEKGKITLGKEYGFCVKSRQGNFYLKGFAVPTICAPLHQRIDLVKAKFDEFKSVLPVNECSDMTDGAIDVLIGSDFYWSLMTEDIVRLDEKLVAIRSKFGYILSGPIEVKERRMDNPHSALCVHVMRSASEPISSQAEDPSLDRKLEKMWDLETIGVCPDEETASLYDKMQDDITFNDTSGRYEVGLPFKDDVTMMDDDYDASMRSLKRLKHSLIDSPKIPLLMEQYDEIIQKQIQCGVVEMVNDDDVGVVGAVRYLPHRPVINEDKSTTKVRIVYNGSAKRKGGRSLNEHLYKGECTTPLIFGCLLRFRAHAVALVGDIESAYLQIAIKEEYRDFLRFLWYKDIRNGDETVVKMRFARVLFGLTPSQFLLSAVIRKHAESYQDPDFLAKILQTFYVDDLGASLPNSQDAIDFYWQCKVRFAAAGFNLRKFRTNDPDVQRVLDSNETQFEEIRCAKVLGIPWDEVGDVLIINIAEYTSKAPMNNFTRRITLGIIASFYDPLGLVQIWVIQLKILFQQATKMKIGWDDLMPEEVEQSLKRILEQIRRQNKYVLLRCIGRNTSKNHIVRAELVGFSDASPAAYGACVYGRFEMENGDIEVTLLASKSRVAPIKTEQTIPRLELLGNLVLTRLVKAVCDSLTGEIAFESIYCYTDSKICLAWISAFEKDYKVFVQNRLNEIRKGTAKWLYCPSEHNPADLLTKVRASMSEEDIKLWFDGPEFLRENKAFEELDEHQESDQSMDAAAEEEVVKTTVHACVTEVNTPQIENIMNIERYSDLLKLLRVTAYVRIFANNLRRARNNEERNTSKFLTANELKESRLMWIRANQRCLQNDPNFKAIQLQLNCQSDGDEIIRTYGRMKNAKCVEKDVRAPILLAKNHRLCTLIIWYCHTKVLHRGVRQTLCEFRSTYWITKGRSFMKKILGPCTVCKRLNSRSFAYPGHTDLPELRFDKRHPFSSVGCDYLGPVYVTPVYGRKNSTYKAYVVIYTCATTRAVILEVVNSADTENFIQSFRRFIARRGCPSKIVSDNGPSFTAEETQKFASDRFVSWQFNVANAPNWGGMWERLVACVKKCLKKTIGVRQVTFIELQTLICEIEMILNNRPIAPDYDDDTDEVLTPNHLVFGRRLEFENANWANVDTELNSNDELTFSKRQKHLDGRLKHFWKIWQTEYLSALRDTHRSTNTKKTAPIAVDDVVIIHEDHVPRQRWKIGHVEEILPSADGKIRAVKLQTSSGNFITRPLYKLYPLESARTSRERESNQSAYENESDTVETKEDTDNEYGRNQILEEIPRREASVRAELKMKYGQK